MIGCVAKALSSDITVAKSELEDAKWCTRAEVRAAVAAYEAAAGGGGPAPAAADAMAASMAALGFFVPPPWAIAHHLLRAWAARDGKWAFAAKL